MIRLCLLLTIGGLLLLPSTVSAEVLFDFEASDSLSGWTLSGNSWFRDQGQGDPYIPSSQGDFFLKSGVPNTNSESHTGIARSGGFQATFETLSFSAVGWDGSSNASAGKNYYQILDSNLNPLVQINTPQSDAYSTVSIDLADLGVNGGDTLFFQAVDGSNSDHYSWLAFDNVQNTGQALAVAVPEPMTFLSLLVAMLLVGGSRTFLKY